jgi:HTH-type transcriptional regulator/antitoxin HigA
LGVRRRLAKVLFTILHKVAHIYFGHVHEKPVIIDDQAENPTLGLEEPADEQAANWFAPDEIPAMPDRVAQGWVTVVAADQGIHPTS